MRCLWVHSSSPSCIFSVNQQSLSLSICLTIVCIHQCANAILHLVSHRYVFTQHRCYAVAGTCRSWDVCDHAKPSVYRSLVDLGSQHRNISQKRYFSWGETHFCMLLCCRAYVCFCFARIATCILAFTFYILHISCAHVTHQYSQGFWAVYLFSSATIRRTLFQFGLRWWYPGVTMSYCRPCLFLIGYGGFQGHPLSTNTIPPSSENSYAHVTFTCHTCHTSIHKAFGCCYCNSATICRVLAQFVCRI